LGSLTIPLDKFIKSSGEWVVDDIFDVPYKNVEG
jgi:hypothetical protein